MQQLTRYNSLIATESYNIVVITSRLTNYTFLENLFSQNRSYRLTGIYHEGDYEEIDDIDKVDIILYDIDLQKSESYGVYKEINKAHPRIQSIIISSTIDLNVLKAGIKLEVSAFLSKINLTQEIIPCLNTVTANNQKYIDPIFHNLIIEKFIDWESRNDKGQVVDLNCLTEREREILHLIFKKDSAEISRSLFISEKTVRSHYRNIMQKLNISSIKKLRLVSYQLHLNT